MTVKCNICDSAEFIDSVTRSGTIQVKCATCKSLPRHRLLYATLDKYDLLKQSSENTRVLQISADPGITEKLRLVFKSGFYISNFKSDYYGPDGSEGNWLSEFLKLQLPDDFRIFSDNYFDLIVHCAVLEHIPGKYVDHLAEFSRILKPGGRMIFHMPFTKNKSLLTKTIEGGELLNTDEERLALHGEVDHYKTFGYDFYATMKNLKGSYCIEKFDEEYKKSINSDIKIDVFTYHKI